MSTTSTSNTPARTCTSITVHVFDPGNSSEGTPDTTVPGTDVVAVDLTERISDTKDKATITLRNNTGQYTNAIESGTRIRVEWTWGGRTHEWTGMVRDREFKYLTPNRSLLILSAEDFVTSILGMREVFNTWEEELIAGTSDAILNEALREEANDEIGRLEIEYVPTKTTVRAEGKDLLEFVNNLARRGNAVYYGQGVDLVFETYDNKEPLFTLTGEDTGSLSNTETDTTLINSVRVDGSRETRLEDEQLDVTDYSRINREQYLTFPVRTRKASIERIDIWTRPTGSEDLINLRVQKANDAGTGPIAPGDGTSDVVNLPVRWEELLYDDFTSFELGEHVLPEPNPWIILESDGEGGQDIGVSSSGMPAFQSYYSYNITVRQTDQVSVDRYRLREKRVPAEHVNDIKGANAIAQEILDHDTTPRDEVWAEAYSLRANHLTIGDAVTLDFAREDVTGDHIVTERGIKIENGQVHVDLSFAEIASL